MTEKGGEISVLQSGKSHINLAPIMLSLLYTDLAPAFNRGDYFPQLLDPELSPCYSDHCIHVPVKLFIEVFGDQTT